MLTLALAIGGNTAIFSLVDQLLLRPLPYPQGDQLVTVYETFSIATGQPGNASNSVSPANWLDWQRDNRTLRAWPPGEQRVDLQVLASPARERRSGVR